MREIEVAPQNLLNTLTNQRDDFLNQLTIAISRIDMLEPKIPAVDLLTLCRQLALAHIGDGDEWGVMARTVIERIDKQYPEIKELQDRS